jgi:hypothetical protein
MKIALGFALAALLLAPSMALMRGDIAIARRSADAPACCKTKEACCPGSSCCSNDHRRSHRHCAMRT